MQQPDSKTAPAKKRASLAAQIFGMPFWIFAGIAAVGGAVTWHLKGEAAVEEAVLSDVDMFLFLVPRMLGGMLLAGLVQVVLPPQVVAKWVGAESGFRGLVIATVVGALTPGGPMTSFPIVVAFYMSGADRGALVAYITAWSLIGFQRFMIWELPLLGPEISLYRVLTVFWMPVLAGFIARQLGIWSEPPPPAAPQSGSPQSRSPGAAR